MACKHTNPQWHIADCNEDGWKCGDCAADLGFRPDFDREHTTEKVSTILLMLHECKFMYVSNSSQGDSMTAQVASACHYENTFDQLSIIKHLIDANSETHTQFWRDEAKRFMCSHPSRTLVPRPTRQDADATVSRCNACGHEVKQAEPVGLFASKEPF